MEYGEETRMGHALAPTSAPSVSWRAIIAGTVVALATQILLTTLGLAVGITTVDAASGASALRGAGIGVGIWYLISILISVFAGGFVAGVSARETTKTLGAIEGLLVWGLALLTMLFVVSGGVQSLLAQASGMFSISPSQLGGAELPRGAAENIQSASTWAAWIAFFTLLLSSAAGVLGGIMGVRFNQKKLFGPRHPRREVKTTRTTAPHATAHPREA